MDEYTLGYIFESETKCVTITSATEEYKKRAKNYKLSWDSESFQHFRDNVLVHHPDYKP